MIFLKKLLIDNDYKINKLGGILFLKLKTKCEIGYFSDIELIYIKAYLVKLKFISDSFPYLLLKKDISNLSLIDKENIKRYSTKKHNKSGWNRYNYVPRCKLNYRTL